MNRNITANAIGLVSVACSLAFWLLLCLTVAFPHLRAVLEGPRFGGWGIMLTWPAAFLLAVAAMIVGARRWALAALLAIVSFVGAMGFLAGP